MRTSRKYKVPCRRSILLTGTFFFRERSVGWAVTRTPSSYYHLKAYPTLSS